MRFGGCDFCENFKLIKLHLMYFVNYCYYSVDYVALLMQILLKKSYELIMLNKLNGSVMKKRIIFSMCISYFQG